MSDTNLSPLEQARQDCIGRKGVCGGCSHALETYQGTCLIKWTQLDVIAALGYPNTPPPDPIPEMFDLVCGECGAEFEHTIKQTQYCQPCRVERNRMRSRRRKAALKRVG